MWIADAGGAPPAGPGIPGPGKPVSVLTAMTFHCITAVASAVAGGAADAPPMPSVPRSAPIATAMNQTDRLRLMSSSLSTSLEVEPFAGVRGQPRRLQEGNPFDIRRIFEATGSGSACLGPRHLQLRQRRRSAADPQLGEDVLEVLADGRRLDPQLA